MLVLFGSLKLSKSHPFRIILYFFRLKGLYYVKRILELPFHLFLDSEIEKDQVIFVFKLVNNSDELIHADKSEFHYC